MNGDVTAVRGERDLIGSLPVPADAYWGVHTARALENFPVSGTPLSRHPRLVAALAAVKQAAALANRDLGLLDGERAGAIADACEEIRKGKLHEEFVVDLVQGGAGTSTNMNANEVIANRALEILGRPRGDYGHLDPHAHVNLGQSTNDAYPTALRVGLGDAADDLSAAMSLLEDAFRDKAAEFAGFLKMGRTQLQDAVPMTLGQEFGAFAVMLAEDRERLREAQALLWEVNLGGTAIGTGLNAHPDYARLATRHLAVLTGRPLVSAADLVEATQDVGALVHLSGVLKRIAVKLSKTANDLRLLSSGPRSGLGEITLPAVQAGSSIMPGKVNPVMAEMVNQVAFSVVGNDVTVSLAAEGGQLQLNAFEPVIARCLFQGLAELTAACELLATRCVHGITADREGLRAGVERSIGLVTALVPHLGYHRATEVAQAALRNGTSVVEEIRVQGLMDDASLLALLGDPARLVGTGG
ncbi:aspartate ammonia-lyase [Streptomyces tagetis]|uniref:Aspartate ammonia-lyase n=1 Tax=Streptomyces tagetis TaxID=2820809 RepID=A0A940XGR6_9ACTN|nr:aspartate ammonia-lyase [Streptomyces sp. RG38]MBQ0826862.1 aspartate ammonia-lyase [Streptomyces sp. RG38]